MRTASTHVPRLASRPRRRARISLTPLIDVVFILLVFFMLASSFVEWRSISLSAPGAPGAGAPGLEGALLVDLRPGDLLLSGAALSEAELLNRLGARLADRPETRILLRPWPGVAMQRAVELLDRLAALGARDIALAEAGR